jgi:hypothetical protein
VSLAHAIAALCLMNNLAIAPTVSPFSYEQR